MIDLEHPDITATLKSGYLNSQQYGDGDDEFSRRAYLREYKFEFLSWIIEHYPDLFVEWLDKSKYREWLEDI